MVYKFILLFILLINHLNIFYCLPLFTPVFMHKKTAAGKSFSNSSFLFNHFSINK